MSFFMQGNLKASANFIKGDQWITFKYVDHLVVTGGGTLDGQGAFAWPLNDCHTNPNCDNLLVSMSFQFVSYPRIKRLRSINSKNAHFNFFGCENVNMSNLIMSVPSDSPNTDGIKIGSSNQIQVSRTLIGTGDDCIAILSGNTNINISEVYCGPGHGISVGRPWQVSI